MLEVGLGLWDRDGDREGTGDEYPVPALDEFDGLLLSLMDTDRFEADILNGSVA